MTNKMKLIFVLAATVFLIFAVMLSTPLAIDTSGRILSTIGHALGLHEAPISSALAVLGIPFLYLVVRKTRHS